ncbi:molybdopterin molybdotransferase MoeA [Streptomyces sp. Je 1-4]|uniref:molybdotransferase-like divisome protein Glp n=1 Tax=Streptomyces TaxID=1883 RepID=UPI00140EA8BE|nr:MULTISPECIES: gephyrin-like molybdotransferase Glp [unclassified Streptomyces]QIK08300.1 molybdopterin molybdotransferase MoeA [Streptomyces sp. ID38640]UYB41934.1 molybdopterin molybdotransferase MoeA [Streptomyces sp. Je 1-4]UZQ38205.1 molybdopterin molybdotransferase MoeA [Streptomyces sp. Je 1-4] [Streptomyces sp. Je 1-4 4N24]UZQ45622.1 molybdopterin molybdotransferase MoeA [Streptomyces sp. Je 1-4] [Streptomyces sp. Je 1-4 4N24_ara]
MNGTTDQTRHQDRVWSVAEHLDDVLSKIGPLDPIELQLLDAQGCVLVEDITVPVALPPFDNSSMDGYAVRAADVADATESAPVALTVIGDVAAGSGELPGIGPGQAVRIMTGAPVPPGADAVVPVEWTDGGTGQGPAATMRAHSAAPQDAGGEVRVHRPAAAGAHIRARGSDVTEGEPALRAGTVLGPSQIGLLAAIGRGTVRVHPRPRVVVLSTGSELVQPGEALGPGQIHDSNSFQLTAAARDAGAIAYRVGAVADDAETLRSTLEDQLIRADILVTSGGVSVGAYDVVKETLAALSAEEGTVEFRRLAMQPGKPQGFGLIGPDRIPLLALPGNPVSSYVSFELFVRPAIRALMGLPEVHRPTTPARCTEAVASSPKGKRQFLRGSYDAEAGTVTPVGGAGSHLIKAMAHANALIIVPEDTTEVPAGAEVDVVLLG